MEVEPLLAVVRLYRSGRKAELVTGIIFLNEIFNDGARLPQGDVSIWVVDRREPAVGINGNIFGRLDL